VNTGLNKITKNVENLKCAKE